MKTNRKNLKSQRSIVDAKISPYLGLRDAMPPDGWLKTIRMALGLTAAQLAKKIGTTAAGVLHFERREILKTATLGSLDRAARAMNCRLVWTIVPEAGFDSLSQIVEKRSQRLAAQLVKRADQTMKLESQGISAEESKSQVYELTADLLRGNDPRIWEPLEDEKA